MYLVNDQNQEYKLTKDAVPDAAFLSSFKYRAYGLIGYSEYIYSWIQGIWQWLVSDGETYGEFYRIYGATNVPEGDYTLEVRQINGEGYFPYQPSSGSVKVHVGDDKVNYVGYEHSFAADKLNIKMDLGLFDIDLDVAEFEFSLPGVFMRARTPGFTFRSADLGGNPLPGTEFMLINRDETVKIIKAAYALGKDTFINAMNLVGTEGFTWEDLSILYNEVFRWDEDAKQITLDDKNAYKLLQTYWALVQASAMDPMITFMSDETDIRLPAILKAGSNEEGFVYFDETGNVTLIWSLEILLRMSNLVLNEFSQVDLDALNYPDARTKSIVRLVFSLMKYGAEKGVKFWDEDGQFVEGLINDWVYPILSNDNVMQFAKEALVSLVGEEGLTEEDKKMLELLPTHAILTKMMPAGNYIMFEMSVPDGYVHSPLFYSVELTWNTENQDPSKWCYASVADLGIILPYYASDYYTYLRNLNVPAEADRILNLITDGNIGTLIQDTLANTIDVSALSIAYNANIIYNYMGGNLIYNSEEDLAKDLTKFLYTYGRTAQNMMIFGNNIARAAKSVVTAQIILNWVFYNYSTSIRTNIALQTKALLTQFAANIDTSGNSFISEVAKGIAEKIAGQIDTTNRIIEETTAVQNAIKETVKTKAKEAAQSIFDKAMKFGKKIFGWWASEQ